ncbi:hypothetical protein EAE96_010372 [Botrytis aclada]|nr:hypothetical protein EAE96_010372 [Botrytis aclada]
MADHNSSRSQYTLITTASGASIETDPLNLAALAKDTQTSNLDSSSSNTDAEKIKIPELSKEGRSTIVPESESRSKSEFRTKSSSINHSTGIENQSSATGDGDSEKIEDLRQQDSEDSSSPQLIPTASAEFDTKSDSQSIHQISAKTEIDHGAASGEGADTKYEVETASQAAAHLDSLDPVNPSVEQDDARRNASIRATIKRLQKSTFTVCFHLFLYFVLIVILGYLEVILPENDKAYFCDRPSMKALGNSILLLISWEIFVLFDILIKGDLLSPEIRYCNAEEIPDARLTEVMKQLSTANATAVAFVNPTLHALQEAVNNATNVTVKALTNAKAQA